VFTDGGAEPTSQTHQRADLTSRILGNNHLNGAGLYSASLEGEN
jgi:hypothetical protein